MNCRRKKVASNVSARRNRCDVAGTGWLGEECYRIPCAYTEGYRMCWDWSVFTQSGVGISRTLARVYTAPECASICGFRHPDKSANGVSTIEPRVAKHLDVAIHLRRNAVAWPPLRALGTNTSVNSRACVAVTSVLHRCSMRACKQSKINRQTPTRFVVSEKNCRVPQNIYEILHSARMIRGR